MNIFHFERLEVYQKALQYSLDIYILTQKWPNEHRFGLTDQLRRASLSIPLNIAEGTARTRKEFMHFIDIAKGSCFECIPIINIWNRLGLIDDTLKGTLYNRVQSIAQMLGKLKTSLSHEQRIT